MNPPSMIGLDLSLTGTGVSYPLDGRMFTARIAVKTKGAERLVDVRNALERHLYHAKPSLAIIEDYAMHAKGKAFHIGELGGVVKAQLHDYGIKYVVVSPSSLKMFATGLGNVDKDVMISTAIRHFGFLGTSNDEADALLLYYFGQGLHGRFVEGFPQAEGRNSKKQLLSAQQLVALKSVVLP